MDEKRDKKMNKNAFWEFLNNKKRLRLTFRSICTKINTVMKSLWLNFFAYLQIFPWDTLLEGLCQVSL